MPDHHVQRVIRTTEHKTVTGPWTSLLERNALCLFALIGLAAACRASPVAGPTPMASATQLAASPISSNPRPAETLPSAPIPSQLPAAVAVAPPPAAAGATQIQSQDVTLTVSANDLTLTRLHDAVPFFSFRAQEAARFQADFPTASANAATQVCARRITVTPVAWAGAFLSLQTLEETGCKLEAHPSGEARFVTWVVAPGSASPVKVASLSDWIAESDLLAALRTDSVVRRALASSDASPTSLAELLQSLEATAPVVSKQSCYAFPGDLLERFAPSHVQDNSLAVRLSLSGAAVCRTRLTELGLAMPLPAKLSAALLDAATGRSGFLKRNAPPAIVGHPAVFELGPIPFTQAHP